MAKPFSYKSYLENDPVTKEMMEAVLKRWGHQIVPMDEELFKRGDVLSVDADDEICFNEGEHRNAHWGYVKEHTRDDPSFEINVFARKDSLEPGYYFGFSPFYGEFYVFRTEVIMEHGGEPEEHFCTKDGVKGNDWVYRIHPKHAKWYHVTNHDDGRTTIDEFTP